MTKSPCHTCKDLPADKNGPTCTNCAARLEYVAAMGAPWDMGPVQTKPKREDKPVSETGKYAGVYTNTKPETEDKPMVEQQVLKRCNKCKIKKPLSDFTKDKTRPGGLALVCRQCKNEYQQKQRATVGRSDTKAGKMAAKIKSIYIDPPLPAPVEHICDVIERTVGQEYGDDFLSIDMAGHGDILDRLTEAAIRELRSVEMQALFILREALK